MENKAMEKRFGHFRRQWKKYVIAIWMMSVIGYLGFIHFQVADLRQTSEKLASDVDSIESILISTDSNVSLVKKQVDDMSAKVAVMHKRVMRR